MTPIEEAILEAIMYGSMDKEIYWMPSDIISLKKKIRYHERAIKACPNAYSEDRKRLVERYDGLMSDLQNFDYTVCKKFHTDISVEYAQPRPYGFPSDNRYYKTWIQFSIDYSQVEKLKAKAQASQWAGSSSGVAFSSRHVHDNYYLMPSLIMGCPIVLKPEDIKRYSYVTESARSR